MYKVFLTVIYLVKYVELAMERFVVGGEFASIQQYPHQVYLEVHSDEPCACGGSILNQYIVLTAAHCLDDFDVREHTLALKYGSDNLNSMRHKDLKSYKIHERYDFFTMQADIALLQCKTQLHLGRSAQKVVIMERPPKQKTGYVSGWGAVNANFDSYDKLKHAKQEIQSHHVCSQIHVPVGSFCAGPIHGSGYPYVGDSGGALMINDFIQIGIVSYKIQEYTLVAYTNVSFYYTWIKNYATDLYCDLH